MIQVDVVVGNVVKLWLGEVELRRLDVLAVGGLNRQIPIDREILDGVVGGKFHAADEAVAVVERREDDRRAELSFVDQVLRLLVEAVDP